MTGFLSQIAFLLGTGLGSGYFPVGPGTAGSVTAAVLWFLFALYFPPVGMVAETLLICLFSLFSLAITNVCLATGPLAGSKDPQQIVIDEWAGLFICFAFLTPLQPSQLFTAFAVFRLLDGTKPWLIYSVQNLPRGYGVVADDLLAGLGARLVVLLIWRC